ncbi:protein kinase [Streptomyces pharetrae]|uniref:serine/threonine-protein kinase n=1 Tax=Streptomyces pharetrae TaxID=291370 RepID=UPI00334B1E89
MAGETPDQGAGRVINGRYWLRRTLGAGVMGRVWLAHDEKLTCDVALKEIALPDGAADPERTAQRVARARSEARHAARLRGHPHVATVLDVVMHEGLLWIVMEYVPDAADLQVVIRRFGPLPPVQVARIGLAVLDALTAGHRVGILHRDVKPANILLAPDATGDPHARVLLTDYGIALPREPRLTATAGILGTPGYLAPERARGEPPTPAADLFSLGATLYCAVEGRGPFDRNGEYATLTALLSEEPPPPARAGALAPVLQGLLVKDPVRRWAPETMARGLERVVTGGACGEGAGAGGFGAAPQGFGPPRAGFGAGSAEAGAQIPGIPGVSAAPNAPRTPKTPEGSGGPAAPGQPYTPTSGNVYASTQDAPSPPPPRVPHASGGNPPYPPGKAHPPAATGLSSGRDIRRLVSVAGAVLVVVAVGLGGWVVFSPEGKGGKGDVGGGGSPSTSATEDPASPTGPVLPYGDAVGLTEPLAAGDCVKAVWTGTPFVSPPNLGVVDCADDWPDGQVVAVDTAEDHADAQANGARRCAHQTRAIVDALPDAGGYAVVPTREGFDAAGGGTACLVLGRHAAIGGEVGHFRDRGTDLWVGQMSVGDCWIYKDLKEGYESLLTDCTEPHTDQVIGTARAPAGMSFDKAGDNATKLCSNKFESSWAPGSERAVFGWMADEEDWEQGFTKVVCTVSREDNAKTTGKISAPGAG